MLITPCILLDLHHEGLRSFAAETGRLGGDRMEGCTAHVDSTVVRDLTFAPDGRDCCLRLGSLGKGCKIVRSARESRTQLETTWVPCLASGLNPIYLTANYRAVLSRHHISNFHADIGKHQNQRGLCSIVWRWDGGCELWMCVYIMNSEKYTHIHKLYKLHWHTIRPAQEVCDEMAAAAMTVYFRSRWIAFIASLRALTTVALKTARGPSYRDR